MWKNFVRDYLTFSKKERYAVLLLLSIFAIVTALPYLIPSPPVQPDTAKQRQLIQDFQKLADTPVDSNDDESSDVVRYPLGTAEQQVVRMHYFDPNIISADEWQELGVNAGVARTIKKYISKGGRFRKPEDLLKIYTLDKKIARQLIPYVRIGSDEQNRSPLPYVNRQPPETTTISAEQPAVYDRKKYREVDINSADTTAFKSFPGIGSRLAIRIINYREALGGFVSIDQLREVRYLPDSTFRKIRPFLRAERVNTRKMNLNAASTEELSRHPYLEWGIARAIVRYREQRGAYKDINEITGIHTMSNELFEKIRPYLTIE